MTLPNHHNTDYEQRIDEIISAIQYKNMTNEELWSIIEEIYKSIKIKNELIRWHRKVDNTRNALIKQMKHSMKQKDKIIDLQETLIDKYRSRHPEDENEFRSFKRKRRQRHV